MGKLIGCSSGAAHTEAASTNRGPSRSLCIWLAHSTTPSLDAAIDLASQDDPVRRAFCEAALAAAGSWRDQNRADLELAFAV